MDLSLPIEKPMDIKNKKEGAIKFSSFVIVVLKKIFWEDRMALFLLVSALAINIAGWVTLSHYISPTDTGIILHYNVFFGIDAISFNLKEHYTQIFFGSIGGLFVWLLNGVLGGILYYQVLKDRVSQTPMQDETRRTKKRKDYYLDYFDAKKLASYVLWGSSCIVQVIVAIYIISILMVNK